MRIRKETLHKLHRAIGIGVVFALVMFVSNVLTVPVAHAGAITAAKDTLGTAQSATAGTHAFSFTTATALTATQTIKVQFDAAADAFVLDTAIANTDFSSVTGMTIVAACGAGGDEVTVAVDATPPDENYTFTVCAGDTVGAGAKTFTIDNDEVTNPTTGVAASYKIDITTTSDSGSISVGIVPDESVNVTATVDPSITFSISDTAIGFGTLSTSAARYANGAATGSATVVAAHTFTLATNATSGLATTYNGALMTSGANDINAATITADADGTPGSEQFAISFDDNGTTFTMVSAYDEASNNSSFVASTTTQILSSSGPVASTTVDAHYLSNIAATTPAGSYSTNITYITTATF